MTAEQANVWREPHPFAIEHVVLSWQVKGRQSNTILLTTLNVTEPKRRQLKKLTALRFHLSTSATIGHREDQSNKLCNHT